MHKDLTSYEVAQAAENGDATAREIYEETGRMLGEACAEMMLFSSPEAFIFFGGLANAGELLFAPIREAFEENVMPCFKGKAKFLKSALQGGDAAILGAARLVDN
jgi:glucokinase